jgi:hypothetical protein
MVHAAKYAADQFGAKINAVQKEIGQLKKVRPNPPCEVAALIRAPYPPGKGRRNTTTRTEGRAREGEEANARVGPRKGEIGRSQA